jgi:hypothetical protein
VINRDAEHVVAEFVEQVSSERTTPGVEKLPAR